MRGGHVDAISRIQVSGWAADSDHPDRQLELCILVDGVEAGRTLAARPRQDVTALGKYGKAGHGFAFVFARALSDDRDHTVSVRFADDLRVLPNGERLVLREGGQQAALPRPITLEDAWPAPERVSAESAPGSDRDQAKHDPGPRAAAGGGADSPAPILVTAPGRSGTTFLMSCLAASPQIVVAELVPYEVRLLSYYAAAFGVLTAAADTEHSTHPDRLEGDGFHIGFNPFTGPQYAHAFRNRAPLEDFHRNWAPARLGAAFADTVREYYRRLAADRGKGAVPYFAEKNNNLHKPSRMFVRRVFPLVREIVIVRDPRDVLCSHMAYFSSSEDKAFTQLSHSCRQLASLADNEGGDLCVIRYEDMVRGDAETFELLSKFLGATVQPVESKAGEKMFTQHATSDTPEASIGRWRRDLPPEIRERSGRDWGKFLEKFGYDLA